jgi:NAD-dependent deacetylase
VDGRCKKGPKIRGSPEPSSKDVENLCRYLAFMKKLVAFTGAGVSAESGIRTFRDSGGLWEEYPVEEVATPEAWRRDPEKVLRFYDMRREQIMKAEPNAAHRALVELERGFDVQVVTQNIDDLHERAGSTNVLHLHGEILKARSTVDPAIVFPLEGPCIRPGDLCPRGSQLRPHIVWFGEEVHMLPVAAALVMQADIMLIVGTSLNVYPAAGLVHHAPEHCQVYLIDPDDVHIHGRKITHVKARAGEGLPPLALRLLNEE